MGAARGSDRKFELISFVGFASITTVVKIIFRFSSTTYLDRYTACLNCKHHNGMSGLLICGRLVPQGQGLINAFLMLIVIVLFSVRFLHSWSCELLGLQEQFIGSCCTAVELFKIRIRLFSSIKISLPTNGLTIAFNYVKERRLL